MKVVDLTEEILRSLKVRDLEKVDLGDNFLNENCAHYLSSEFKKAVINKDGEVVFVFGGKITSEFGIWTWLLGSELINENPVASLEILVNMDNESIDYYRSRGIKYFYTFNNPSFSFAIRFLERLRYVQKDLCKFDDGVERILLIKEF